MALANAHSLNFVDLFFSPCGDMGAGEDKKRLLSRLERLNRPHRQKISRTQSPGPAVTAGALRPNTQRAIWP